MAKIKLNKQTMMTHQRYKYQHLKLVVLDTDANENVLAFAAVYHDILLPGESMSRAKIEINRTLWNRESTKRPKNFFVLDTWDGPNGLQVSVLIHEEWLKKPRAERLNQEVEWQLFNWLREGTNDQTNLL